MNRLIRVIGAFLGVVAAFAWPHPVRAQAVAQGSFVLPFEVQWEGKTLPAGEYHFSLRSERRNGILIVRDAHERAKMLVITWMKDDFSGPSTLTIVERNGRRYVSALALGEIETKLEYLAPSQKPEASRPTQASVQIIPVQVARS